MSERSLRALPGVDSGPPSRISFALNPRLERSQTLLEVAGLNELPLDTDPVKHGSQGRWLARAGRDVTLVDLDPQKSLWDIAALLGRPDGVFTRRLRLAPDGKIPASSRSTRSWVLVDTPPALDGSLPALQQADYVVIPVIPEAQEVAQLEKFLTMLEETRQDRPFARIVGILPVRYVRYWAGHRACLAAIEQLAEAFGHPVLEPVPTSQAVIRYSIQGGLWRHVATTLMALEPKASELSRAA